jgi:formate hydrogenlyase subunit 3/multisubunit Na+/H+ antiporter MnhD subunit
MELLTLAPGVFALLILIAGLLKKPLAPLTLGLAALGALVPVVCLLLIVSALHGTTVPLWFTLFGGSISETAWFSAAYRIDPLGIYAAFGITCIVAPLLIWMAWQRGNEVIASGTAVDAESDQEGNQESGEAATQPFTRRSVSPAIWGGLALALGVESAALTLVFSDNALWLALSWVLLAIMGWGLGEVGSDPDTLDKPGLALMVAGPLLWALFFLFPAFGAHTAQTVYPRFTDMMGRGGVSPLQALALAVALALAGGAYPFLAWVRARAALITPAGLTALALVVLPAAIFVGARTYSAAQNAASAWQQIGQARPPVTGGVFFALLGALTVGICGLLALERRDGRALIAFLAASQVGWGLLAIGIGVPESAVGLVALLGTTVLGLGAMLAAQYAGDTLTSDIEPDAAGPRPFGAPVHPVRLAAWIAGALALVGAPLCAGFVPRQLTMAGAIHAQGLTIPLSGLAWAGDALLFLALLRAVAPAFTQFFPARAAALAASEAADDESADGVEVAEDAGQSIEDKRTTSRGRGVSFTVRDVPAALLGLLVVVVSVAPQALLTVGALPGATALLQASDAAIAANVSALQYTAGPAQVVASIAWIAAAVFFVLRVFLMPSGDRESQPVYLAGRSGADLATADGDVAVELAGLPAPRDTWQDLKPTFDSAWTLPGAEWLMNGMEDEAETDDELEGAEDEDIGAEDEAEVAERDADAPEAVSEAAPVAEETGEKAEEVREEPTPPTSAAPPPEAKRSVPTAASRQSSSAKNTQKRGKTGGRA